MAGCWRKRRNDRKNPRPPGADFLCSGPLVHGVGIPKQQGNAPDRGQAHQGIDHAADGAAGATEQEGDQVKAEDADAAPIQAADNGQNQSDLIHDHGKNLLILGIR